MAKTPKKINWEVITNKNRSSPLEDVKAVILSNDGFLSSFTPFSDIAICLVIEIEERRVNQLRKKLEKLVTISEKGTIQPSRHAEEECQVLLNISFIKGTGNLKNTIPQIPG